jgi:hypothetical protein
MTSYPNICFSCIKHEKTTSYLSVYLAMTSRKRCTIPYEEDIGELIQPKRDVSAPNICSLPIEGMSPAFDPNRALLRHVFFSE